MPTSVSITEQVREKLVKIAAELQMKQGKRVDLNDAIDYLIARAEVRPELLDRACRPIAGPPCRSSIGSAYKELIKERIKDEERSRRRYGV